MSDQEKGWPEIIFRIFLGFFAWTALYFLVRDTIAVFELEARVTALENTNGKK